METGGSPNIITPKKTNVTPKAIIFQKYGDKACYRIEEVQEPPQNGCPGLAIPQKATSLFRCTLQLPDIAVESEIFRKKKDAEQSAAQIAIEKLGINVKTADPTVEEAWHELISRLKYLFSDEFLSSLHPLSGHFRAALERKDNLYGLVPFSVIAVYDAKVCSLSKTIDLKVESNFLFIISFIMRAAARLSDFLATSEDRLSIRRKNPYPADLINSLLVQESDPSVTASVKVIHIPCSREKHPETLTLDLSSTGYYLDLVAKHLGLSDAAKVFISRPVGKASGEIRLYFAAPETFLSNPFSDILNSKDANPFEGSLNKRASYLSGQDIYGDAILASIGYKWKLLELFYEDILLQSYYRMLLSKTPSGVYKLSREAILAAELPLEINTRANWRGPFPRDILCTICRQQRLSEPIFSPNEGTFGNGENEPIESGSIFGCNLRIYSKSQDLVLECSLKDTYKKQNAAIQSVSLKVLSWLDTYFKDPNMPLERLKSSAEALAIQFSPQVFLKEFSYSRYQKAKRSTQQKAPHTNFPGPGFFPKNIEGPDSGVFPSNGSLSCISYSVFLITEDQQTREPIESSSEFEFEMGSGVVIPHLEAVVSQMSVGQSGCFRMDLHPKVSILAAACDSERTLSLLDSKICCLEYKLTLLRVTEPLEDRMEQALFSPPLSKQRVEFALQHIRVSCASTLVDFGCGSGSLLDSLMNYQSSLETIVGVDISQKSLSRAAKTLHSKLSTEADTDTPSTRIKSAVLYEGSITEIDPRLCEYDIGTCLEVIEHMEEDQASVFGNLVLSSFRPKILVLSTPNYEYNVLLQKSNISSSQEEDQDVKTQYQSCKFRNFDHKFEWTRDQFNRWATELAERHDYSVEFGGVGGTADVEPGFASQIAVFRRGDLSLGDGDSFVNKGMEVRQSYKVIWEWKSGNK